MELTRDRILEQVAEIMGSAEPIELTVAGAAARARVSVRTAYRYFPTRDALIDAFNAWIMQRFGSHEFPTNLDELPGYLAELFRAFHANEQLIRASRRSEAGAEVRSRRKAGQVRAITKAVRAAAPELDDRQVRKLGSTLHLFSADAWIHMHDNWGLTTDESIEAMRWALEALITKLRKEAAQGKKPKR
jgi:AcrR family transcriptional regulator